jgi:hypothetical protein
MIILSLPGKAFTLASINLAAKQRVVKPANKTDPWLLVHYGCIGSKPCSVVCTLIPWPTLEEIKLRPRKPHFGRLGEI